MSDKNLSIDRAFIERIAAERQRQMDVEGWTSEHDDQHMHGELARAATCYVRMAARQSAGVDCGSMNPPLLWPWDVCWWKPSSDPTRNLEKAGALILAEMARIARAGRLLDGVEYSEVPPCPNS